MTFAAVGAANDFSSSTFTLTPANNGDLLAITVRNITNNTVTVTGVSSSNATWTQMGSNFSGSTNADTQSVWAGKATSTSAATVTVSWSGATPTTRVNFQEFSSTVGNWAFDSQGHIDTGGTNTWASLTATAGELYFGSAFDTVGAVAGSTSGYTYVVDSHGNGMAYNPNTGAGATAPVWGDSTMAFGVMVLIKESSAAAPAGTVQPLATFPTLHRKLSRAVVGFIPVTTINTGHGAAGTVQPLATFPTPRRRPSRVVTGFVPVRTVNTGHGPAGTVQPLAVPAAAPRRHLSRAVVQFIPVKTTNNLNPPVPFIPPLGGGKSMLGRSMRWADL